MLITLWLLGYIELYFADESGFTLQPYLPYAWQKKGQTQRIFARNRNKRLNVLGLMSLCGSLTVYYSEQSLNGEFVKNSLEDFSKKSHQKPCVIMMDNGPIHRAKVVTEQFANWEEQNLHVFFLPKYSPHLNPIEILWRFCKYRWLHKEHYKTWAILKKAILSVFKEYGSKYVINFKELICRNTSNNIYSNSA